MTIRNLKALLSILLVLVALVGVFTGCIPVEDNNQNGISQNGVSKNDASQDGGSQNGASQITPLAAEELEYFNGDEFFNGEYMNIRNQFLVSFYDVPEKINLLDLFYCGSGHDGEIPTKAERAAVVAHNNWGMEPDCACIKISRANMDEVLTKYTGLTLEDTNKTGLECFTYLEQYDAYYLYHGDTNYLMNITFFDGEREGDIIRLFYDDRFICDGQKVLTLKEQNGTYIFVSNKKQEG